MKIDFPFPDLDQSIGSMQSCYTFAGSPERIDHEEYPGSSLDWKMLRYGEQARARILCKSIFSELSQLSPSSALKGLQRLEALVEFIWFLFGQKKWRVLFEVFETMGHASLGALPDEVFDLFLLSTIRLNGGAFTSVQQAGLLFDRLDRACAILETAKPDAIERLQLFKAIQEHTRGQEAKARKSLLDISKPTQFCGPFRAVDTVLGAHQRTVPNVSEIDVIRRSDRSRVVVVSLNKKYFEKHLEGFVRSFFDTARGTVGSDDWGLHLHCVGFEPAETNWLDFKQPEIGVSLDWNSVAARKTAWEGAYCASARYLFAPLYLRMYSCLFVCDVDGVFTKPLEPPSGGREDVLLTSNRYLSPQKVANPLPWNSVVATSTFFTGAEGSLNFADSVSGYLATIFQNEEFEGAPWYADQSALYYSFLDERERLKFGRLEDKYFQQGTDWRQFFSEETKKRFSSSSLNIEK